MCRDARLIPVHTFLAGNAHELFTASLDTPAFRIFFGREKHAGIGASLRSHLLKQPGWKMEWAQKLGQAVGTVAFKSLFGVITSRETFKTYAKWG